MKTAICLKKISTYGYFLSSCDIIADMNNKVIKKVVAGAISVVALAALLILTQSAGAQNYTSSNLIKTDGSGGRLSRFQVGAKDRPQIFTFFKDSEEAIAFNTKDIKFRSAGDTLFDSVLTYGNAEFNALNEDNKTQRTPLNNSVNIGFASPVPNIAKLQIDGDIQIQSLVLYNDDPTTYCTCVNESGSFLRCGVYDPANGQNCSAPVTPTTDTYQWVQVGDWGACSGFATDTCSDINDPTKDALYTNYGNSCIGTYTTSTYINWDGDEFNWTEGQRFKTTNVLGGGLQDLLIAELDGLYYSPSGSCYEVYVSGNSWRYDEFSVVNGSCNWTGNTIQSNQPLQTSGNPSGSASINTQNSCTSLSQTQCGTTAGCSWEQVPIETGYCSSKTTQTSCTAYAQCGWTSASDGVQTQTVRCQNQTGTVVDDSLCTGVKPSATRACTPEPDEIKDPKPVIEDIGTAGCYPLQYSELGPNPQTNSAYSLARTLCSSMTTKSTCNNNTYYWNQGKVGFYENDVDLWSTPVFAMEPYPGVENDYAIHSYGMITVLVPPEDIDFTGQPMPYVSDSCRPGDPSGYCYRSLGPTCIWGVSQ